MLYIKRAYEAAVTSDGFRILVDRLWPRGLSKDRAALDLWLKDIAPSSELRTWFNHDPVRFAKFSVRYKSELLHNPAVKELQTIIADHQTVTLIYAAHDREHNDARVLLEFLSK